VNKTQLAAALDRMDRLYPNVTRPDYRDEVIGVGAAFPPLSRTARQLSQLLQHHRRTPHEELLAEAGEEIRELHDRLRADAQRLLDAPVWPYD